MSDISFVKMPKEICDVFFYGTNKRLPTAWQSTKNGSKLKRENSCYNFNYENASRNAEN